MCRRVTCRKCNKPSWAGCGAHVEQVLGNVPKANRCQCREEAMAKRAENSTSNPGFLGRLKNWMS